MGAVDKKNFTWWNTILNLSIHIQNKVYKLQIEKCFSKLLKTAMKFYQVMQVHVVHVQLGDSLSRTYNH